MRIDWPLIYGSAHVSVWYTTLLTTTLSKRSTHNEANQEGQQLMCTHISDIQIVVKILPLGQKYTIVKLLIYWFSPQRKLQKGLHFHYFLREYNSSYWRLIKGFFEHNLFHKFVVSFHVLTEQVNSAVRVCGQYPVQIMSEKYGTLFQNFCAIPCSFPVHSAAVQSIRLELHVIVMFRGSKERC
jgi:hypothetical protein